MFIRTHKTYLRTKRNLYVKLIVFLGMLYMPAMLGCGNSSTQTEGRGVNDSIKGAKYKQDSIAKAKEDSVAFAKRDMVRRDSIAKAKADSAAKAYQLLNPPHKYGVIQNDWKPQEQPTKYGVPTNYRND
jgi:hypothetical protein